MDIASILVALLLFALVGFVCYLIVTYIPMPAPFKEIIVVLVVVVLALYLISLVAGGGYFRLPLRR